ncbi:2-C-methyl-D-erythritol 4-phosphate cytidylyltransferase [Polaromonas vacuolata]|uniref:2-C-methyl-D-erythritol 4-phosphate cytidylyltransferase n=2 Tax=Polaromonas vacuolata TaxID=37448 RepID=A0A6H2H8C3_9BURK|nr:2-C-methyl-D-erythritol 4-phosphate cytidylyltransferase [Polaromonas vacuolata]
MVGVNSMYFRIYDAGMTLDAPKSLQPKANRHATELAEPPLTPSLSSLQSAQAAPESAQFFVLIPCAGHGSRAGRDGPKQYQHLLGKAMVWHTLQAFRQLGAALSAVAVVVAPDDTGFEIACPDFGQSNERRFCVGGATRADSVLAGLRELELSGASQDDWVLVHDAARCLIEPAQILALIAACRNDAVGGLLALPLADTLKTAINGRIATTLNRDGKWLAQTPQMFRLGPLIQAMLSAGTLVTDESSAMEFVGLSPLLVAGSAQNFKVTYPADFALAEAVLSSRI